MNNLTASKRLARFAGVCLSILIIYCIYDYLWWHIKSVSMREFLVAGQKQRYFAENFPTRQNIEDYVSNNTFLEYENPFGNTIYYYSSNGTYISWHQNSLEQRRWFIEPILYRRLYLNGWKLDIAYVLCLELIGNTFMDGCHIVTSLNNILPSQSNIIDQKNGDIFGLSKRKKPPFDLPITETTIGILHNMLNK